MTATERRAFWSARRLCAVAGTAATALLALGGSAQARADQYGAIAMDPDTGRRGFSYDYPSRAAAQRRALRECGTSGCRTVVWFRNGCGAVARGGGRYGWGVGASRPTARRRAVSECGRSGCRVIAWACTTR